MCVCVCVCACVSVCVCTFEVCSRASTLLNLEINNTFWHSDQHFPFLNREIILWIEFPWPQNPASLYAWHTETLDIWFDLIRCHQQGTLWSPPLEIKPVTKDGSAETLQLSHLFISHTSYAKITSPGNCSFDVNCVRYEPVSARLSVVAGSISSGGDYGVHC